LSALTVPAATLAQVKESTEASPLAASLASDNLMRREAPVSARTAASLQRGLAGLGQLRYAAASSSVSNLAYAPLRAYPLTRFEHELNLRAKPLAEHVIGPRIVGLAQYAQRPTRYSSISDFLAASHEAKTLLHLPSNSRDSHEETRMSLSSESRPLAALSAELLTSPWLSGAVEDKLARSAPSSALDPLQFNSTLAETTSTGLALPLADDLLWAWRQR
jgi:hypothetical protein